MREMSLDLDAPSAMMNSAKSPAQPAGILIIRAEFDEFPEPAAQHERRIFFAGLVIAVLVLFAVLLTPLTELRRRAGALNPPAATRPVAARAFVPAAAIPASAAIKPLAAGPQAHGVAETAPAGVVPQSPRQVAAEPAPQLRSADFPLKKALPPKAPSPKIAPQAVRTAQQAAHTAPNPVAPQAVPPVKVPAALVPRISTVSVSSASVPLGYGTTLCLQAQAVRSLSVTGLGAVAPAGLSCHRLVPQHTTTYTIWAVGNNGATLSRSFTVSVGPPPGDYE